MLQVFYGTFKVFDLHLGFPNFTFINQYHSQNTVMQCQCCSLSLLSMTAVIVVTMVKAVTVLTKVTVVTAVTMVAKVIGEQ